MEGVPGTVREQLHALLRLPGNGHCADCLAQDPDWASTNLGVFICIQCSGIHRKLGTHISQVKSVKLDDRSWSAEMIQTMAKMGNDKANCLYARNVPIAYKRPSMDERTDSVLREQWIRAKYERKEFMGDEPPAYLSGKKQGILFKKGKGRNDWKARWFSLDESTGNLSYFKSRSSAGHNSADLAENLLPWDQPLGVLPLRRINACLAHDITHHPNSLQISVPDGPSAQGRTRNIFVYSERGQDIVEWLVAIRHARHRLLKLAAGDLLSRDFIKAGYLHKTGPQVSHGWKKRWFVLDNRKLRYYAHPLDPFELHEIFIGHESEGFKVMDEITDDRRRPPQYGITLVTPQRTYYLNATMPPEHAAWAAALKKVVETEDDTTMM